MEARLKQMVMQLLRNDTVNSRIMVRLLQPNKSAIALSGVMVRFDVVDERGKGDVVENGEGVHMNFRGVLDIKIFGRGSTVEIGAPVQFVGMFDEGGLLNSVDIKFDCGVLLRDMIEKARVVVKQAVKEAAEISLKVMGMAENGGLGNLGFGGNHGNPMATGFGAQQNQGTNTGNDGAGLLTAALNLGAGPQLQKDNSALLAALRLGQQRVSNQTAPVASVNNNAMLAALLQQQQQQQQQQGSSNHTASATSAESNPKLVEAIKLNEQQQRVSNQTASVASVNNNAMLAAALLQQQQQHGSSNRTASTASADSNPKLVEAMKLNEQQQQQGASHQTASVASVNNNAMLAAALLQQQQQQQQQGSSNHTASTASTDSDPKLVEAMKLNEQQQQGASHQTYASAPSDSNPTVAAASKLDQPKQVEASPTLPADSNSALPALNSHQQESTVQTKEAKQPQESSNENTASQAHLAAASSLAQLSSLLNSTSTNRLANPTSALSFSSFFGNSVGNLRNESFANFLKSSNSLNRLGSTNWGMNQGGESAAILQRHLNIGGSANASGNANATFDFGTSTGSGNAAQAQNLLLGLVGGSGDSVNTSAKVSSGSMEGMKSVVRFQEPSSNLNQVTAPAAAAASINQGQASAPKQQTLTSIMSNSQTTTKSQYDTLRDLLLTKSTDTQSASAPSNSSQPTSGNIHKGLFSWIETTPCSSRKKNSPNKTRGRHVK